MCLRIIIAAIFLNPLFAYSQKIGDGIQNIYKSVGFISFNTQGTNSISSGTGTLLYKSISPDQVAVFLVTCKHVLPTRAQANSIRFIINNDSVASKSISLNIPIYDRSGKLLEHVKFDSSGNDLAVLNITYYLSSVPSIQYLLSYMVPATLLATKDSIRKYDVKVGRDILFVGYPSFFFEKRNIYPILRQGIIATPPMEDFYFNTLLRNGYRSTYRDSLMEKLNGFLIDATAIGGSSGSLVFLKPIYFQLSAKGELQWAPKGIDPLILGILTYSYFDLDGRQTNERINLGGVIAADAIKAIIDTWTFPKKAGG